MLIRLDELPEPLLRRIDALRECISEALALFAKEQTRRRHRYSERSEASIIHDYMVAAAKARFPWSFKRNLFLVRIEGFRAKLKKLNANWRPRNIATQLSLRFENQEPLRLFDDLDVTHLFLGYQRNDAEIQRSRIWLVCPDGPRRFKWIAELTELPGRATGGIEFAIPAQVQLDPPRRRRITPKGGTADERQAGGRNGRGKNE